MFDNYGRPKGMGQNSPFTDSAQPAGPQTPAGPQQQDPLQSAISGAPNYPIDPGMAGWARKQLPGGPLGAGPAALQRLTGRLGIGLAPRWQGPAGLAGIPQSFLAGDTGLASGGLAPPNSAGTPYPQGSWNDFPTAGGDISQPGTNTGTLFHQPSPAGSPVFQPQQQPQPGMQQPQGVQPPSGGAQGGSINDYIRKLIQGGMSPQDAANQANHAYGRTHGNEAVYYSDTNTIGLPDTYMDGASGWGDVQRQKQQQHQMTHPMGNSLMSAIQSGQPNDGSTTLSYYLQMLQALQRQQA